MVYCIMWFMVYCKTENNSWWIYFKTFRFTGKLKQRLNQDDKRYPPCLPEVGSGQTMFRTAVKNGTYFVLYYKPLKYKSYWHFGMKHLQNHTLKMNVSDKNKTDFGKKLCFEVIKTGKHPLWWYKIFTVTEIYLKDAWWGIKNK